MKKYHKSNKSKLRQLVSKRSLLIDLFWYYYFNENYPYVLIGWKKKGKNGCDFLF